MRNYCSTGIIIIDNNGGKISLYFNRKFIKQIKRIEKDQNIKREKILIFFSFPGKEGATTAHAGKKINLEILWKLFFLKYFLENCFFEKPIKAEMPISDLCWWLSPFCRCTRAGLPGTTMRRPRKLQIITLQVSHCFYKFHICCAFLQSICFKRGLFFCVQKKKRKREKTQDSGGETSNDCRSHWKGRCRWNWRDTLQMKRHKFAIVQKWSANFW